jgi:mRNA-degrading endonuclease RelE of RelBE toxin-antitoxin system
MTREQLEHAIRAACEVAEDSELWIFGSQSILGRYPDAPAELRTSIELDVQPKNRPDKIDVIDGLLGELSLFHQTHGFYVHGDDAGSWRYRVADYRIICEIQDDNSVVMVLTIGHRRQN